MYYFPPLRYLLFLFLSRNSNTYIHTEDEDELCMVFRHLGSDQTQL